MIEAAARDYAGFLVEVKARIRRGQYEALRAENAELVGLYSSFEGRGRFKVTVCDLNRKGGAHAWR